MYKEERKCLVCDQIFIDYLYRQRKYCGHACSAKATLNGPFKKGHKDFIPPASRKKQGEKMRQYKAEKSWNWKGSQCGNKGIHSWLIRTFGSPKKYLCEICKKRMAQDWSSKTHEYKRIRNEFRTLCRKCHMLYDFKMGFRSYK